MGAQTVLITGCSAGGIGHALVVSFQRRGYTVFATARSLKKMDNLASLPNVHLLELDVINPASVTAVVKEIEARTGGKLDVLVNNAGLMYVMPALDADIDTARAMFEVNYWGPVRMIEAFSPMLIQAQGCIVNVGSGAGEVPIPFQSHYNASKAAINLLSDTLRYELAPLKVRVITVIVGNVATYMSAGVNSPPPTELPATSHYKPVEKEIGKHVDLAEMSPSKFADQVVDAVAARASGRLWKGANIMLVKWVMPLMPSFLYDRFLVSIGRGLAKMPKPQ